MFKCKQCGQQFTSNVPETCPVCGVKHDRTARGLWLIATMDNIVSIAAIIFVVAGVFALTRYLF